MLFNAPRKIHSIKMKYFVVRRTAPKGRIVVSCGECQLLGEGEMTGCASAVAANEPLLLDKMVHGKYVVGNLK